MSLLGNDGEAPISILSTVMNQKAQRWDSANIAVKSEGKWLVFYDKNQRELNCPHLAKERVGRPASYKFRGYLPPEPEPKCNPLIQPPVDNYTEFRARRRIYGMGARPQSQRVPQPSIDYAHDESKRYFHGDNPKRNPFRISTKILNEQRIAEAKLSRPQVRPPVSARSVRSNYMDLYEKSLKPRRRSVWPPDDYFDEILNTDQ
ncbi:hypothetical protein TRFO_06234 [Tritrichomonas foetus]|uniref:Uncharacterized protein n=1 Tax=Tritrichomonas foetus TaxID=1144522 RepID=A0A1J4K530_9EUKA|nr:hypothetical protein TRFO_06234 [Tritrichomonas foetus]|eukprot:OHT04782.1 hypothetical protein TRFO_06234 [Tritrichomonas foetus]